MGRDDEREGSEDGWMDVSRARREEIMLRGLDGEAEQSIVELEQDVWCRDVSCIKWFRVMRSTGFADQNCEDRR